MTNFIPQLVSTIIQVTLFLAIPFIWWLVTARKQQSFLRWLGWTRPQVARPGRLALIIGATLVLFAGLGVGLIPYVTDTSPSPLTGLGFAGIAAGVLYATIQTAFTEESLFRGFLLKRIAARFGFWAGNISQGVAFGLAHTIPLIAMGMDPLIGTIAGFYSGVIGLIIGWANEKLAGGSLFPGWIWHALANLFSAYLTLFVLG